MRGSVVDRELQIREIDYEQWEYNRLTGTVEGIDYFDEENTRRLCELLGVTTSAGLIRAIIRKFSKEGMLFLLSEFREFCNVHGIVYTHEAWY